jgi:hypothetical protein
VRDRIRHYWNQYPVAMPIAIAVVGLLLLSNIHTFTAGSTANASISNKVETFLTAFIIGLTQSCVIVALARWLGGRMPWKESLPGVFMMIALFSLPGGVVGWPAAFPLQIVGGMIATRLFQKLSWIKCFVCGFAAFFSTIILLYTVAIIRTSPR